MRTFVLYEDDFVNKEVWRAMVGTLELGSGVEVESLLVRIESAETQA